MQVAFEAKTKNVLEIKANATISDHIELFSRSKNVSFVSCIYVGPMASTRIPIPGGRNLHLVKNGGGSFDKVVDQNKPQLSLGKLHF